MAKYNLTAIGNTNSTIEFIQNVNTHLMNGYFGVILLGIIAVIIYSSMVFASRQPIKSFVGAGFITTILAALFFAAKLITNPIAIWIPAVGTAIAVAFWNTE